jgi:hypothetical protein
MSLFPVRDPAEVARAIYQAYVAKDRLAAEALIVCGRNEESDPANKSISQL